MYNNKWQQYNNLSKIIYKLSSFYSTNVANEKISLIFRCGFGLFYIVVEYNM